MMSLAIPKLESIATESEPYDDGLDENEIVNSLQRPRSESLAVGP